MATTPALADLRARFLEYRHLAESALERLGDEDFNLRDLERTFAADPTLTLKLLRIANSAANGSSGVDSVRKAICYYRPAASWPASFPIVNPTTSYENRPRKMGHNDFCSSSEVRRCIVELAAAARVEPGTGVTGE